MPPWIVLVLIWPCCTSRGSRAPGNPQVSWSSFLLELPSDFPDLWGLGLTFSFLGFVRSKACPSMDLGPTLWTLNGFGPPPPPLFYWKPKCFPRFQSFVLFWALVQHCNFLNHNRWLLRNLNYTKFNKAITWKFATTASRVAKESKIVVTTKLKIVQFSSPSRRTHNHNIFLDAIF